MSMSLSMLSAHAMTSLVTVACLSAACALLSLVVVLRRWSFAAEGIGHSGFGGAGTAWIAALAWPAAFENDWAPYLFVILFCTATALAIARLTRAHRVSADAAVGVFLVASLAWGFLAQQVYFQQRHALPAGFDNLLFGQLGALSSAYARCAVVLSLCVIATVGLLRKEIVAYCFDPLTATTSGIPSDRLHDLLMVLLAIVIVLGARVAGSVLVVAMLVLPGATSLLLSRQLHRVIGLSVAVGVSGAVGGVGIAIAWPLVPAGPAIVLCLFVQFIAATIIARLQS